MTTAPPRMTTVCLSVGTDDPFVLTRLVERLSRVAAGLVLDEDVHATVGVYGEDEEDGDHG